MRAVQILRSRSDLPRKRPRTGSSMVFYNSLMEPTEFTAVASRTARRFSMDLSRSLVMVSGGPDSVALLRTLVELEMRPVVLHVDHGLRGEESLTDAKFVRELCEGLGLVYEERRGPRGEGEHPGGGPGGGGGTAGAHGNTAGTGAGGAAPDPSPPPRHLALPRVPGPTLPHRPDQPHPEVRSQPGTHGGLAGAREATSRSGQQHSQQR